MDQEVQKYQKLLSIFVALHIPLYGATVFFMGLGYSAIFLQTVLAATAGVGFWLSRSNQALASDVISTALALTPAVLVYMFAGHPWQIDAHMYFFAVLAMIVGFKSYRSVLAGATVIALHHLSLNFLLPYVLFPNGSDFFRVVFHAVIVVAESGVLLYIIHNIRVSDAKIKSETKQAKEALAKADQASKAQKEAEEQAKIDRVQTLNKVAGQFEKQVGSIIQSVEESASSLQKMAETLSKAVQKTTDQSSAVASASQEASSNVDAVAAAAEQMTASITEISKNVSDTAQTAKSCAAAAKICQDNLQTLQNAVNEIDSVVQGISEVAEQTNLLALNATIEAARAGDAGKGFAVVANEVKSLATQTHNMTEEISQKVNDIKTSSEHTITSVNDIITQIDSVDEKTSNVAGAVEEQSASAQEISNNAQQAAVGTNKVSENIRDVQQAASESATSTGEVNSAAGDLHGKASDLKTTVEKFLKEIRSS